MTIAEPTRRPNRSHWALVLAAGDGTRLQEHVQQVLGQRLPKQYVNFIGRHSMIEHTFKRAETLISRQNIMTIVGKQHLGHVEVRQQLASRHPGTVIVQPANKETGPGILLPLMHIYKRCPDATVSVFPSDHFILEEARFMTHVELAAQAVTSNPSRIVLLAMEAHSPEEEYGYLVPMAHYGEIDLHGTRGVARFVEKPTRRVAHELFGSGALWNTMVMVFKVSTLLEMVERIDANIHRQFARIFDALGTRDEQKTVEAVYAGLQPMNFSKAILEHISQRYPGTISVLPVLQVYWSDLGSPQRLLESQRLFGPRRPRAPTARSPLNLDDSELVRIAGRALA